MLRSSVAPTDPISVLSKAVGRGTRAEQLAAAIDSRIREQNLEPGAPIGTLASFRGETGFAYSTVSEAVRLLRDRGVLEIRQGRGGGLFVAERSPAVRLRHTLLSVAEEAPVVADAIELRDHLEILIDTAAARHRSRADIADLGAHLKRMESAPDWDTFLRANWALHERIATIVPNGLARSVYIGTLGPLHGTATEFDNERDAAGYRTERFHIHVELVDAISVGDVAAVHAAVVRHNTPA